jgi:hypothetical protein
MRHRQKLVLIIAAIVFVVMSLGSYIVGRVLYEPPARFECRADICPLINVAPPEEYIAGFPFLMIEANSHFPGSWLITIGDASYPSEISIIWPLALMNVAVCYLLAFFAVFGYYRLRPSKKR